MTSRCLARPEASRLHLVCEPGRVDGSLGLRRPLAQRQSSASVPPRNGPGAAQAPARAQGPGLVLAAVAPPSARRGAALHWGRGV